METTHRVHVGDARSMNALDRDAVDLVVTSPPYPMIEMWDEAFTALAPAAGEALERGDGDAAFAAMHAVLDEVWAEAGRVLAPGGIACINVGDATRTLDGTFRVYRNHARVADAFEALGLTPLPGVIWRKPANSAAKFMGSGTLPPNAYVTLEHEHVLIFRNGDAPRSFPAGADRRYESAYFWEERNRWFSDLWTDVRGERQRLDLSGALRERSAAFPFAVPYRLINMYSVYGDRVLDPFWGTGTTSVAATVAARDSVGYELESDLVAAFRDRIGNLPGFAAEVVGERLADHRRFLADYEGEPAHEATHYGFPVVTKQERDIRLYGVESVTERESDPGDEYAIEVEHGPV